MKCLAVCTLLQRKGGGTCCDSNHLHESVSHPRTRRTSLSLPLMHGTVKHDVSTVSVSLLHPCMLCYVQTATTTTKVNPRGSTER